MVFINKSTIEIKEKLDDKSSDKYDNGYLRNFKDVLGNNIFLWFIPIKKQEMIEGYAYEINQNYIYCPSERDESKNLNSSIRKDILRDETIFEIKKETE